MKSHLPIAIASLALLTTILAACSVGEMYRHPDLDVPERFRGQEETPGEKSLAELAWWEVFGDQNLQQLLNTALAQNRDVKIAAARVLQARAQFGVSKIAEDAGLQIDTERFARFAVC